MNDETPRTPAWSQLPNDWFDTLETVHLWTQIIGKIRMVSSPWVNHSWSVPLYPSPTGLRTSLVPYGTEGFEWSFDLVSDRLDLVTTTGRQRSLQLNSRSVADLYDAVMHTMVDVAMPVDINPVPNEVADPIPFPDDRAHHTYDPDHARRLWRALLDAERVFTRFRAGYLGKASPVHFFWGSFDLAVTRFSGRRAPVHAGGVPNLADDVTREAYSHELTSCGFWPGNRDAPEPVFYAYAYPTPPGFPDAKLGVPGARWEPALGEFVLPHRTVAAAADPDRVLLEFVQSAHDAASELGGWDRTALECAEPHGPDWWHNRPDGGYPTPED